MGLAMEKGALDWLFALVGYPNTVHHVRLQVCISYEANETLIQRTVQRRFARIST
jgi:hypothetical protein